MKKLFHPVVGLWLLFSLICGIIVSESQFTADMSAFLPQTPSARQQILIDQISEGFASRALIISIEGAPIPVLAQLSKSIGKVLRENANFSSVSNGQNTAGKKDNELIFSRRYSLSPAMGFDRMSVDGLRTAINDSLAELGSSTGLFSKLLINQDPTGEALEVMKQIIPSTQLAMVDGVWMNSSQTRALLLAQTNAQGSDLDGQEQAHASIRSGFSQAKSELGSQAEKAQLRFSGPGLFAVSSRDSIRTEAARLSALGTAIVLTLLWFIYRSMTALFLGILPVLTGAVAGIAAVGLGFNAVHGMTLGFGVTLIGEAVDYAIYLFVQRQPPSDGDTLLDIAHANGALSSFWPTIRLGVLTSIFGFSALLFSGFTGLAQLGLFSIVGIIVAALMTRFVLPILLPQNFYIRQPIKLGCFLFKAVQSLIRYKLVAIAITAAAILVLIQHRDHIWSAELGGLSPVSQTAQNLDTELRAEMGASGAGALLVIKAKTSESVLQTCEEVADHLNSLVIAGKLAGFQAPSNYLPSQRLQQARQAALPEDTELRRRVALALKGMPLNADKLEPFFTDVSNARTLPPLTRADFVNTSLLLGIDSLLTQSTKSSKYWTALITLQPTIQDGIPNKLNLQAIEDELTDLQKKSDSEIYVLELGTEASRLYQNYLHEALTLTTAGFFAIVLLLSIALRSLARMVRVVAPLLVAVVWIAAGTILLKGSLSLMHLIGLLLVVAVGSNYALFFDNSSTNMGSNFKNECDNSVLCSLFFANLTTVSGFGLLAFSSAPVMSAIGSVVGAGTFLALILSAVFAAPQPKEFVQ